jgi:hypothetical protein
MSTFKECSTRTEVEVQQNILLDLKERQKHLHTLAVQMLGNLLRQICVKEIYLPLPTIDGNFILSSVYSDTRPNIRFDYLLLENGTLFLVNKKAELRVLLESESTEKILAIYELLVK